MEYVSLPSEYRQVEWLESTGTQYIDSGIECTSDLSVDFGFNALTNVNAALCGGILLADAPYYFRHHCSPTTGSYALYWIQKNGANTASVVRPITYGVKRMLEIDAVNGKATLRDPEGSSFTNNFTPISEYVTTGKSFGIMARIASDGSIQSRPNRCYYFKFYRNNTLIGDFIPCYRISDSKPGMYDFVTDTFYTNAGTGEFIIPILKTSNDIRRQIIVASSPHLETLTGQGSLQFTTHVAANLKECKIYFTPKQDLHGYDKPWVGGAGKNLFDKSSEYLDNTYVNDNGTVTDPPSTSQVVPRLYSQHIKVSPGTSYVASGSSSSSSYIRIVYYDENDTFLGRILSSSMVNPVLTFTPPEGTSYVLMNPDASLTNVQLEKGSTATAYEPYENICPIEGWDGVTVGVTGKNLTNYLDPFNWRIATTPTKRYKTHSWGTVFANGETVSLQRSINAAGLTFILGTLKAGVTYTLQCLRTNTDNKAYIAKLDSEIVDDYTSTRVFTITFSDDKVTFTPKSDGIYEVLFWKDGTSTISVSNLQLEEGSQKTDYEPFSQSLTIPFPRTIYGGYIDLIRGEVVETHSKILYDGVNKKANVGFTNNGYAIGAGWRYISPAGKNSSNNKWCDKLRLSHSYPTASTSLPYLFCVNAGQLYNIFYLASKSDYPNITTAQQMIEFVNDWLQENPTTFVYDLATPNTYSITPQTIKTLKGLNNIFTNANGNIEIKYWSH